MSRYLGCLPTIGPARARSAARRRPPAPSKRPRRYPPLAMAEVAMLKHAARLDQPIPALDGPEFRALDQICEEAAEAGRAVFFVSRSGLLRVTVDNLASHYNRAVHIGPGTGDADVGEDL